MEPYNNSNTQSPHKLSRSIRKYSGSSSATNVPRAQPVPPPHASNATRKKRQSNRQQPKNNILVPVETVQINRQKDDGIIEIEINGTKCIIYPDIKVFENKPLKYESPEFKLKLINDLYASAYDKLYKNDIKN